MAVGWTAGGTVLDSARGGLWFARRGWISCGREYRRGNDVKQLEVSVLLAVISLLSLHSSMLWAVLRGRYLLRQWNV